MKVEDKNKTFYPQRIVFIENYLTIAILLISSDGER